MRSTARRTAEGPLIILPQNNTPWPQHEMSVRYHNILIRWTFAGGLIARGCATEAREDRRAAHETTSSEDRERRGRDEGETRGRRRSDRRQYIRMCRGRIWGQERRVETASIAHPGSHPRESHLRVWLFCERGVRCGDEDRRTCMMNGRSNCHECARLCAQLRWSPESPLVAQRPDKQIQPAPDYSFRASAIPGCADGDRLKYWSYRE